MYAQGLDFCVILCPVKLLFNINYRNDHVVFDDVLLAGVTLIQCHDGLLLH